MNLARAYAKAVVLPDGKVFVTVGAHKPKEFYDGDAQHVQLLELPSVRSS